MRGVRVVLALLGALVAALIARPPATAAGPPGPVTNLQVKTGVGAALVSWSPPADDGGSPIIAYEVRSPNPTVIVTPPATSTVLTGLPATPLITIAVVADNALGESPSAPVQVTVEGGGTYHALTPARILDTRDGTGGVPAAPIGPSSSLSVQVAGRGGVPASGVSAVVVNVTVTNTSASSFLTVFPTGTARPLASNLNWMPGVTVPNLVTVGLGTGSREDVFNLSGTVDVIFDVAGWVGDNTNSSGPVGMFNSVTPARRFDTREGFGPLVGGSTLDLKLTGSAGVPTTGVNAVVLNVTVTNPTAPGFLTVWPSGAPRPLASDLNFSAGQTVPNRVIATLGANGQITIFNSQGFMDRVDVIVDVSGWFTDDTNRIGGSSLVTVVPNRVFDSRTNGNGPVQAGSSAHVFAGGTHSLDGEAGAVVNVTAVGATQPTFLTVWPDDGSPQPPTSDLNVAAGQTVPNLTFAGNVGFKVFNSAGAVDVVVDTDALLSRVVQPIT